MTCVTGTASAEIPAFAAKRGAATTTQSNPQGQGSISGELARLITRPYGQISVKVVGVWMDITPFVRPHAVVTDATRDWRAIACEVVSFKGPDGAAASTKTEPAATT